MQVNLNQITTQSDIMREAGKIEKENTKGTAHRHFRRNKLMRRIHVKLKDA